MNATVRCPFDIRVDGIARFLNCELVGHPIYDGLELQWFDDAVHGRGLLAFLSRRSDRRVDYYLAPGLSLDPATYAIAGGTGAWSETTSEADCLEVGAAGVVADVRFRDRDGRLIEVAVDDRAAGPRTTGDLLAPVGAGIDAPTSLALVVLHGFDLVRRTVRAPRIRIDGQDVPTGSLPGARLHRRHLLKAAAPLTVATICPARDGPLAAIDPAATDPAAADPVAADPVATDPAATDPAATRRVRFSPDGRGVRHIQADDGERRAELRFAPPFPALEALAERRTVTGRWDARVDGSPITGGTWSATRVGDDAAVTMDVTDRWRPASTLPLLLRLVTTLVPVFRRWPTTYRWHAEIRLAPEPWMTSRWERTVGERGEGYRRLTRPRLAGPVRRPRGRSRPDTRPAARIPG